MIFVLCSELFRLVFKSETFRDFYSIKPWIQYWLIGYCEFLLISLISLFHEKQDYFTSSDWCIWFGDGLLCLFPVALKTHEMITTGVWMETNQHINTVGNFFLIIIVELFYTWAKISQGRQRGSTLSIIQKYYKILWGIDCFPLLSCY